MVMRSLSRLSRLQSGHSCFEFLQHLTTLLRVSSIPWILPPSGSKIFACNKQLVALWGCWTYWFSLSGCNNLVAALRSDHYTQISLYISALNFSNAWRAIFLPQCHLSTFEGDHQLIDGVHPLEQGSEPVQEGLDLPTLCGVVWVSYVKHP